MLYFISLGLWKPKDMSLEAYEILKHADVVYFESYTVKAQTNKQSLEAVLGRAVDELSREELEQGIERIIEQAKTKDIALCAIGDVFSATTHAYYMALAKQKNVAYKVVHGSSIFSAVAKIGLSLYRYGQVVSLPHPSLFPTYPKSPFDKIRKNLDCGYHTLVLLDIGMKAYESLELFEKQGFDKELVVAYGLGSEKEQIYYGAMADLKELVKDWGDEAQIIVVPSDNLEFYEQELLEMWKTNK